VQVKWRFATFDEYWRFVIELAGGISMLLRAMCEPDREAVRSRR
jgi:hypothetical protein